MRAVVAVVVALCALLTVIPALVLGDRALVLVEDMGVSDSHSLFFASLRDSGVELTFKMADEPRLALVQYGERLFDSVLVFAPSVEEFGGSVSPASLLAFVDMGGSVLVAASSEVGEPLREFAASCGVEFDEEKTAVIDHFHHAVGLDAGDHTTMLAWEVVDAEPLAGRRVGDDPAPVIFRGVGQTVDPGNELVMQVLSAESNAYSAFPADPIAAYPMAVGRATLLVTALQARNNARVVFSGSLDLFSDRFFRAPVLCSRCGTQYARSGNEAFATALGQWVCGQRGVVRVKSVTHHLVGGGGVGGGVGVALPEAYTINDHVHYEIEIEELRAGEWVPFEREDVQLDFHRIDPFVRKTLERRPVPGGGGRVVYATEFQLPDVIGVFKFLVEYRQPGFQFLRSQLDVSVVPYRHDEYERFILAAYPYYASAFSMMGGLFVFSFVFLYHRESKAKQE